MWVHLLDDWNKAIQHCAKAQSITERRLIAASSVGNFPKNREDSKLHEIYTTLVDVCLNPLEPIALGVILPGSGKGPLRLQLPAELLVEKIMFRFWSLEPTQSNGIQSRFKPRVDLALEAAAQFSEFVDVTKVLRMIPDNVNLKLIAPFLKVCFPIFVIKTLIIWSDGP